MDDVIIKNLVYGLLAIIFAGLVSFTLTPIVRVLAYKFGAIDIPEDGRRMHKKPTPRMGGVAIFFGFVVSVLLFCNIDSKIIGMLIGSFFIVVLGIFDDIFRLNAWLKFALQIVISLVPVLSGVRIDYINFFGHYINFGAFGIPVTVFWIVAVTNAINIVDGLDGLACGISTISAISIMLFALIKIDISIALLVAILAGACLGFLPYNRNPAMIFMGDTGALFLGYTLSIISIMGLFKLNAVVSFWIPFLVFGLPLIDTGWAAIRRMAKGESPFHADRGHLHHKLIDLGFNQKQVVTILYAVSSIFGISAILFTEEKQIVSIAIIIVAVVIGALNYIVLKGDAESRSQMGLRLKEIPQEDKENSEENK